MLLLVLRVLLAPLLVGGATLVTRRWGPGVGGRIVGLPLTAGPLLALVAAADGDRFAAHVATFDQAGDVGASAWCVVYALVARRHGPLRAALTAMGAFAAIAVLVDHLDLSILVATVASAAALLASLHWWPRATTATTADADTPVASGTGDDLGVRMAVAAVFTFALTESAALVGAGAAGVIGALPLVTIILTVATHHRRGSVAANELLHGVMAGSFSVIGFLAVAAVALPVVGAPLAFAGALGAALAAQLRRRHPGLAEAGGDDTGELELAGLH